MNLRKLAEAGVADCAKGRPADALDDPSAQYQPRQAALLLQRNRSLGPACTGGDADYRDRAKIVNDLGQCIAKIMNVQISSPWRGRCLR